MINLVSDTTYGKRCAMRIILTKADDKMTVKHSILCTAEYYLRVSTRRSLVQRRYLNQSLLSSVSVNRKQLQSRKIGQAWSYH